MTVLIVDHQSHTQEGQNYQKKGAFGSVYKENLARSVLQIERVQEDREAGTLQVRIRHRKSNFGPRLEPFDVILTFGDGKITTKTAAIEEAEKAGEETIRSGDRVLAVLKNGPLTVKELVESTGLSTGTVRNRLSELVPNTLGTADLDGRTKVYGHPDAIKNLSSSLPHYKSGTGDDRSAKKATPASFGLKSGESSTVAQLQDAQLTAFLEDPPEWFRDQAANCMREGTPERLLNPLANAVSANLYGSPWRWQKVKPAVERWLLGSEE